MKNRPNSSTNRLALSYLAVIMALSLCFSAAIFSIMSSELDRPLPPRQDDALHQQINDGLDERLEQRNTETRTSVLGSLAIINGVMLAGGTAFSYYLARRTLRPIEAAMAAQSQFISDASHEIRTPLTALQTSNEVVLRKAVITESKARDVFTKNIVEIEKLRGLADALLSLAKTEQANDSQQTTRLDDLLAEVASRVQPLADKKHCTVNIDAPAASITANSAALQQIITILLDNAIKYSPEKSAVQIAATVDGNKLAITIRDNGIGIAAKDLPHIFDRFYRADTARTRTDTSGHGLGLAIAKQLADRHGYTISCDSTPGRGSVFTVRS